jgi:hypothetical protein
MQTVALPVIDAEVPAVVLVLVGFGFVTGGCMLWQWQWGRVVERMVWAKLTSPREPSSLEGALGVQLENAKHFRWATEQEHWESAAEETRQTFLSRTKETAEKWRTIFAALLGLFGTVLLIEGPAISAAPLSIEMFVLLTGALIFALHAVAFTGWASAGLPKILVDVTGETLYLIHMGYASRALVRLRIGLVMGAVSALALTLAAASWLSLGLA